MIKATEIRRGMVINLDGENFAVLDFQHITPGNWRAMVQTKLRNLSTGSITERRLRSTDTVETPFVEKKTMEYLYSTADQHYFMDTETYDQTPFATDMLGDGLKYMKANTQVQVVSLAGKTISIELPRTVDLQVTDTPPALKGATATNQYKDATLETGAKVQVPPFIQPGEMVRVDTSTGEYVERVRTG